MLPSLLQRLAWHSSNVRSVAQFTPAIGCASARYLRCCSTVCRSCLQLRPPPAPSSPPRFPATPKQPSEGQRGPAVCRIAASATVAYTLRGTNDTAGITCVTSLVARFTSGERVAPQARLRLRPLPRHEPADRLLLHTCSSPTPRRRISRAGLWRAAIPRPRLCYPSPSCCALRPRCPYYSSSHSCCCCSRRCRRPSSRAFPSLPIVVFTLESSATARMAIKAAKGP